MDEEEDDVRLVEEGQASHQDNVMDEEEVAGRRGWVETTTDARADDLIYTREPSRKLSSIVLSSDRTRTVELCVR